MQDTATPELLYTQESAALNIDSNDVDPAAITTSRQSTQLVSATGQGVENMSADEAAAAQGPSSTMQMERSKNPRSQEKGYCIVGGKLPTEIRLEILMHYLRLPNGIHTYRWSAIRKARVDKLLEIPNLGELVGEALFRANDLTINPSVLPLNGKTGKSSPLRIIYPKPHLAQYVRHLNFELNNDQVKCFGYRCTFRDGLLWTWLRKLADGDLGFDKLESFCIVLHPGESRSGQDWTDIPELTQRFNNEPPLRFRCKTFELVFRDHVCDSDCKDDDENCAWDVALRRSLGN